MTLKQSMNFIVKLMETGNNVLHVESGIKKHNPKKENCNKQKVENYNFHMCNPSHSLTIKNNLNQILEN